MGGMGHCLLSFQFFAGATSTSPTFELYLSMIICPLSFNESRSFENSN